MAERVKMSDEQIKALIAREISLAESDRATLSKKQTKALEYFQGEVKDLPAEEGRSKVVSRDLADTMGWMLPGIIRVFTASDRMALCEPVGVEDEAFAKQATDGINYTFWKENDGYRTIYNATWDAMLCGNGIVKVYWDETPKDTISYHSGLGIEELTELVQDENVEVLAHSEDVEEIPDPESGQMIQLPVHSVKIRRRNDGGKTCVEAIPPEDYGIDGDATTCRDARFQYHRSDKTRSDLIKMGFDRDIVESLGAASKRDTAEQIARDGALTGDDGDQSTELVDYYECFIKADVDGDGVSEMCRVYYAGNKDGGEVLDWEVWEDENPFYDIPYEPMPHRFTARSLFDKTEDVVQVKTVMLRQANDNTYASNNPQRFVKGKITNPEELFSPTFGGAIFGDADSDIQPLTIPFVANHAYDALNYQDQVIQRRTGVARQTMALDPDALTNQSATANQNEKDANYSQVELVARNMAEFGWVHVFKAILRLEVKHQKKARTIRMGRKPVKIDPRWWSTDMDVTVDVGLGTGSRDRDAATLTAVMGQQMAMADRYMVSGAPEKAIELLPYVHNAQVKFAEAVGLKNPESYYPEVTEETVAELKEKAAAKAEQPDPKIAADQAKAMADAELQKAKDASDRQLAEAKAVAESNLAREKAQAQIRVEAARSEQAYRIKVAEIQADLELRKHQTDAEIALKERQIMAEMALKERIARMYPPNAGNGNGSSAVHMGGEPG